MPALGKKALLRGDKRIESLVKRGNFLTFPPLHIRWAYMDLSFRVQAAFSVPKRNFSRAVDRNTIRRRMKEAYRIRKDMIFSAMKGRKQGLALLFIYRSAKKEPYAVIDKAMEKVVSSLSGRIGTL